MSVLDIDCGNSRIKWRIVGSSSLALPVGDFGVDRIDLAGVTRARICSVAGAAADVALARDLTGSGVEPEFAQTGAELAGCRNAYAEPQRMGTDRWLAMVAAWADAQRAVCVLDAGSAMTADIVDAGGQHLGGLIAPGLRLMRESLFTRTARIPPSEFEPLRAAGRSTDDCVAAGVTAAFDGFVARAATRAQALCGDEVLLVLAGGDLPQLEIAAAHLGFDVAPRPDLVLDGLALALP